MHSGPAERQAWASFHQIGDLIFVAERTWLSRSLRAWQAAIRPWAAVRRLRLPRFSHVMICVTPGVYYHADRRGVDRVYAEDYPFGGKVSRVAVKRRLALDDRDAAVGIQYLCAYHRGKSYNYAFNFSRWFGRYFDKSLYCSELASLVCERMGVIFAKHHRRIVPFDLQLQTEGWADVTAAYLEADRRWANNEIERDHPVDGRQIFEMVLGAADDVVAGSADMEEAAGQVQYALSEAQPVAPATRGASPAENYDVIEMLSSCVESLDKIVDSLMTGIEAERLIKQYRRQSWRERDLADPSHVFNRSDSISDTLVIASMSEIYGIIGRESVLLKEIIDAGGQAAKARDDREKECADERVRALIARLARRQPRSGAAARKALADKARALEQKCRTTAFPRRVELKMAATLRDLTTYARFFCALVERCYDPRYLANWMMAGRLSSKFYQTSQSG